MAEINVVSRMAVFEDFKTRAEKQIEELFSKINSYEVCTATINVMLPTIQRDLTKITEDLESLKTSLNQGKGKSKAWYEIREWLAVFCTLGAVVIAGISLVVGHMFWK